MAGDINRKEFGRIGDEFINIYSQENPILEIDDLCYFMFTSLKNFHRPIIASGYVNHTVFLDGMNVHYYIKLKEILEPDKIIREFVMGNGFNIYPISDKTTDGIGARKFTQVHYLLDFNTFMLKIESFFVRNSHEKILKLRNEYIQSIRKDVAKQLVDIDFMIE